uniref:Erythropoietin n=1 Tax=Sinocyclocheilus grahami TaxID=75366 RepID=A0A672KIG4_SINGR
LHTLGGKSLLVLSWSAAFSTRRMVLDHFVEARDSEVIMVRSLCRRLWSDETYFVPLTSVDFAVWEHIDVSHDVLLVCLCLSNAMKTVSNSPLANALDNNISNIHSLVLPDDSAPASTQTQEVSSLPELLQVHSSFLRGKVRLLLSAAPACQRQNS